VSFSVDAHRNGKLSGAITQIPLPVGCFGIDGVIAIPGKTSPEGFVPAECHQVESFGWFEAPNEYGFAHTFGAGYYIDAVIVVVNLIHIQGSGRAKHGRVTRRLPTVSMAGGVIGEVAFRFNNDPGGCSFGVCMNQLAAQQQLGQRKGVMRLIEVDR